MQKHHKIVDATYGNPMSTKIPKQTLSSHRTFGYRRCYGKRSIGGYGADSEELEALRERVAEMFHRASQIDDEQCGRRLICEVNAESNLETSVRGRPS